MSYLKFAQVLNEKAHWIFESETEPQFAPNIVIVEITPAMGDVREGWNYDEVSRTFTPPEPLPEPEPTPTIEQRLEAIEMTSAHTQIQVDYVAFLTEILAMPK